MSAIELIDFVDIGSVHDSTTVNYRANVRSERNHREKERMKKRVNHSISCQTCAIHFLHTDPSLLCSSTTKAKHIKISTLFNNQCGSLVFPCCTPSSSLAPPPPRIQLSPCSFACWTVVNCSRALRVRRTLSEIEQSLQVIDVEKLKCRRWYMTASHVPIHPACLQCSFLNPFVLARSVLPFFSQTSSFFFCFPVFSLLVLSKC